MSSGESGLSIASWSLWGGATQRMRSFLGGGGGAFMSVAFVATCRRFCVQLGWLVLGRFGVPGAEGCILCSYLRHLAPLG